MTTDGGADPRFSRHCRPGERVLASAAVRYHPGHEDLGRPPGSWGEEAASYALQVGGPRTDRFFDRLVGGTSLRGWPGCWAEGLRDVVDADVLGVELAVTDQRVLALPFQQGEQLLWVAERGQVTGLRRAPRPLQRGRLRVDLADGSTVMVLTGMLATRSAVRLAGAW